MFELRSLFRKRPKKKKVKVRRKAGGERENKPKEKRPSRESETIRRTGTPEKKQSIVKKRQAKAPVKKVTPTEVATRMKRGKGKK